MLRSIDVATDLAGAADLDVLLSARTADGGLPDSPPKTTDGGRAHPARRLGTRETNAQTPSDRHPCI